MSNYDEMNKKSLLNGFQIKLLRGFHSMKNSEQMINIGPIYYLFSEYWSGDLAHELRKQIKKEDPEYTMEDDKLIEKYKPLRFFSTAHIDWNGIKGTLEILERTRKRVNKTSKKKGGLVKEYFVR